MRNIGSTLVLAMLLGLASAPPAVAQGLPSDLEEKFGLRPNERVHPRERQELMREYHYLRRQEIARERARRRYEAERRRYRWGGYRYDDDDGRRPRYRGAGAGFYYYR
jgi:hypothetical protein